MTSLLRPYKKTDGHFASLTVLHDIPTLYNAMISCIISTNHQASFGVRHVLPFCETRRKMKWMKVFNNDDESCERLMGVNKNYRALIRSSSATHKQMNSLCTCKMLQQGGDDGSYNGGGTNNKFFTPISVSTADDGWEGTVWGEGVVTVVSRLFPNFFWRRGVASHTRVVNYQLGLQCVVIVCILCFPVHDGKATIYEVRLFIPVAFHWSKVMLRQVATGCRPPQA